jgi:hypothetical protein
MVNSKELIGTTEHETLYTWCRLNRCRYNRVPLHLDSRSATPDVSAVIALISLSLRQHHVLASFCWMR